MKKIAKKKMTLDNLAILMAGGFSGLEERLTKKIDDVEKEVEGVKNQLAGTNKRIDDFVVTRVKYEDHNKLKDRVDFIEKKLEIKS